jgi:hypothetical protein
MLTCRATPKLVVLLAVLTPVHAHAREGTVAIVNLGGSAGSDVAARVSDALRDLVGGQARQPGVAAYLIGRPEGKLPAGEVGKELEVLVGRLRSRQTSQGELGSLGRLLSVDYLLLMAVRGGGYTARLFSVHRLSYAPDTLQSPFGDSAELRAYVRQQTRPARASVKSWLKRWWVVGLAAVVCGVTLGVALGTGHDQNSGELRIRATH